MTNKVLRVDMSELQARSYLDYSMSVITSRALPDVRDGLKPVHKRILHSMNELGNDYNKPYKKSARIVGDCLGKYHPHGDGSVYGAAVLLSQDFNMRYPLIDGHGNFGSVDGDAAAAMRYTEMRFSSYGQEMLKDINKNTVDMNKNFDETLEEPSVLPTLLPNLIVNGSSGIAVGMATNMAPHNLGEVYDALQLIIDNTLNQEETTLEDVMQHIKGPDFPTYGMIMGLEGIKEAYKTGKGKIVTRGHYEIETNNNKTTIAFSDIPFRVNKASLITKINELAKEQKTPKGVQAAVIPGIKIARDETGRQGFRIAIELKKDVNPQIVLNNLFKHTQLQDTFSVNNVCLVDREPKQLSLLELLNQFLAHSADVIIRKTNYDLEKSLTRAHLIEGYIKASENLDQITELIKNAQTHEELINKMCEQIELSSIQADAISEMKLRSLTKMSTSKYQEELSEINTKVEHLNNILNDNEVLLLEMKKEYQILKDKFADKRRTEICLNHSDIEEEDLIKEENLIITLTTDYLIKAVEEDEYKSQKRGGKGVKGADTSNDEMLKTMLNVSSKDDILFFTNLGRCHVLKAYKIAKASRTSKGRSVANYLSLEPNEVIKTMISTDLDNKDNNIIFITKLGIIKRLELSELSKSRSITKVVSFKGEDELIQALIASPTDKVLILTEKGQAIHMDLEGQIRPMGRTAVGVKGITLRKDDFVVDMLISKSDSTLFTITESGLGKRTNFSAFAIQNRGGKGITAHKMNDKTGRIVAALEITNNDELFLATNNGIIIRIPAEQISILGRSTTGSKVVNLNGNDQVASISKSEKEINKEE